MAKVKKYQSTSALKIIFPLFCLIILYSSLVNAQNWVDLPPYNTLWPLWSSVLSPIDNHSCKPTPIVASLTPDTILPVMPGLTWDPSLSYPWLLYNTLIGLAYYDPLTGINLWPPSNLLNNHNNPNPIKLPESFGNLPPTDVLWIIGNLPIANNDFINFYFSFLPPINGKAPLSSVNLPLLSSLLTPTDILGLAHGVPTALIPPIIAPIINPTAISPIPTILSPTIINLPLQATSIVAPIIPLPTVPVSIPSLPIDPLAPPIITTSLPPVILPSIPVPTVPIVTASAPIIPVLTVPVDPLVLPTVSAQILTTPSVPIAPSPILPVQTVQIPLTPIVDIPSNTIPTTVSPLNTLTIPVIPTSTTPQIINTPTTILVPTAATLPAYSPVYPIQTLIPEPIPLTIPSIFPVISPFTTLPVNPVPIFPSPSIFTPPSLIFSLLY